MDLSLLAGPLADVLNVVVIQLLMPVLGAGLLGGLGWASAQAARVLGQKNADQLKHKIIEAIINNLQKTAGVGTPGTISFTKAVNEAVDYAKAAYPQAIKKLGAKDGPLQTIAAAELNKLIVQGMAKVLP